MISYFYLAKDLSAMDAGRAALLLAFVRYILSAEGQALASNSDNMFSVLPQQLIDYNTATLASLVLPAGTPTYLVEPADDTNVGRRPCARCSAQHAAAAA